LQDLGVEILYRRDDEKLFENGEEVTFGGFIVTEENTTDKEEFESAEVRRPFPNAMFCYRFTTLNGVCFRN
jgi:hypothetical protein